MTSKLKERYTKLRANGAKAENLFEDFASGWKNNGVFLDGEQFTISDALAFTKNDKWEDKEWADAINVADFPQWIPRVITNIALEAQEPILIIDKLFKKLPWIPGQQINLGATGALAGEFDLPETGHYPEFTVTWNEGTQIRNVGRQGAKLVFTQDILKYSIFPAVEYHVRQLAQAMARYKEEKGFSQILNTGSVSFDNADPAGAGNYYGMTTGRGEDGAFNGSMRVQDLMKMMIHLIKSNFMPNLLIMHTLAWTMWLEDPNLKEFAQAAGGGVFFGGYSGTPFSPVDWYNFGGLGNLSGQSYQPGVTSPNLYTRSTAAPSMPGYFNFGPPLSIVVTPFLPYDEETNQTDIILADSNALGYLIEGEPLSIEDHTDFSNDLYYVKLKERYSMLIPEGGRALTVAKNVQVTPGNAIPDKIQPTMAFTGSITPVPAKADQTTPYTGGSGS